MQRSYSPADVSVCAAYWAPDGNHHPVAATIWSVIRNYPEAEISLADDGSKWRLKVEGVRIFHLDPKQNALNPCVPINLAVRNSTRPVIVLTNPGAEIQPGMIERLLSELTPNGYVAAACREETTGEWLCHSTFKASEKLPPGAGFHFLAMLTRELWDRAGGFDEDYREGQGYEDADFLWRLHAAGATFKILDDVVVSHRRSTTVWPAGGLERNRDLYRAKRAASVRHHLIRDLERAAFNSAS